MLTFNHFNFNVLNLEKSLAFYKEALDLTPAREKNAADGSFKLVYLADDHPAVYTVGRLPAQLLIRRDVEDMEFSHIHVLIRDYMGRDVAHALNEYIPMTVPEDLREIFQVKPNTPLDSSHQVFYDITDLPVAYNTHFFNPDYYRLRTLQNWDLGR